MSYLQQHNLVMEAFKKMSKEKAKKIDNIKRLIFIDKDKASVERFWQLLRLHLPHHQYNHLGVRIESGHFELKKI